MNNRRRGNSRSSAGVPGGGLQARLDLGLGDLPEGLHHRLPVALLRAGGVQRGRARIDQVDEAARGQPGQLVARSPARPRAGLQ